MEFKSRFSGKGKVSMVRSKGQYVNFKITDSFDCYFWCSLFLSDKVTGESIPADGDIVYLRGYFNCNKFTAKDGKDVQSNEVRITEIDVIQRNAISDLSGLDAAFGQEEK
ncbi:hypothetical protein AGMMS49573_07860 [Endomicrobiia bacterium]|nr:hypothetical protein AGMMS49573_07860 [Endomicrobiia bacterium]